MEVLILNNQTLFDLALQATGNALNAIQIAYNNNLSITTNLTVGDTIKIGNDIELNKDVFQFYLKNTLTPATGLTSEQLDVLNGCEGIGCWYIDSNFIVQ